MTSSRSAPSSPLCERSCSERSSLILSPADMSSRSRLKFFISRSLVNAELRYSSDLDWRFSHPAHADHIGGDFKTLGDVDAGRHLRPSVSAYSDTMYPNEGHSSEALSHPPLGCSLFTLSSEKMG